MRMERNSKQYNKSWEETEPILFTMSTMALMEDNGNDLYFYIRFQDFQIFKYFLLTPPNLLKISEKCVKKLKII